jgi:hypothetical protein
MKIWTGQGITDQVSDPGNWGYVIDGRVVRYDELKQMADERGLKIANQEETTTEQTADGTR